MVKHLSFLFLTIGVTSTYSCGQYPTPHLIGSCEGCEAVLEYGDKELSATDTLPGFAGATQKLKITGTIYESDGTTPAEGVILYIYHTDENGIYAPVAGATGWARRHGYRRGWVKTGADGRYTFYTGMPGSYPNGSEPAHIHPIILEPDGKYYWLGGYFFAGDPLLTRQETAPRRPSGGSTGVMQLQREGDLLVGSRDFVLGRNVAGYE